MAVNIAGCGACNTKEGLGQLSRCGFGRPVVMGFQKLFSTTGDRNYLDTTSATLGDDLKEWTEMTVTDETKRLFLTPSANVLTIARSDENFATDQSNQRFALGTGELVTVTAEYWDETDLFAARVRDWTCSESQVYFESIDGKFLGSELEDVHDKLYGWRIVPGSLTARFMPASAEARAMVKVSFDLEASTEKQSYWAFLDSSQLGYNPLTTLQPAWHMNAILTPATSTTLAVVLRTATKSSNKYDYARDLTTANGATWTVYNSTTNTTVVPSGVTFANVPDDQIVAGNEPEYTVTIAAQAPGDDLQVRVVMPKYLIQPSGFANAL